MEETSTLTTERLILKAVTPTTIHEWFNTKTEAEIREFFGLDDDGYAFLKTIHEGGMETFRYSSFYFLLVEKESGKTIGDCGFHTWDKPHRKAELFYNLRKDEYKRKGYMSEALKVVLDYGFNELGLHRIKALVADYNTPSVKLLHKYGFTFEGTMREDYVVDGVNTDSDCYSLLKQEWEANNQ